MIDPNRVDWAKMDGLVPVVVQHYDTGEVRMLGYMNRDALDATIASGLVTFFSRSRGALWRKGETSGNLLDLVDIRLDCDRDALLVHARPRGPTCHTGTNSCFGDDAAPRLAFLAELQQVVAGRAGAPPDESYTARLVKAGLGRMAQKVGEEGVEVALSAVTGSEADMVGEAADLLYHLTVLLHARGLSLDEVGDELRRRHSKASAATA
ncbi:bifunctional phosphoribosyl-AMP cyclohydrolase/phosphoribosyl-ATP diphosphatase HisIE [Sphingomonas rhizophila]|uniref:Histidine biosynthesis bifunctional protein HisIE n=1 Tax=Sphingomonas rhizophila TaxID=2071607 RepID=A0A7G9SBT5_9SPHN|nr:bifunctional phosphoribosyl-AMP cyclohydrolase/phosphoribosyl-ATP diphosphatase HisIE [Sphingomonas rhizophila]QNN65310.1 bifunctional phosphoribosyl-AMP cyclohydrolase/phosphoribosyl-ATP diphosphatase HisIE [Sphingomonas rhizophila]